MPIPGKASDNPSGSGGNGQKQSEKSKTECQLPVASVRQRSAGLTQADIEKPSAEDAGNAVTVSKLPTVSIGKDWADWSYWGFGGILVMVGSLQVWFLYGTLKAIQIQARHMERQTKILEDSVSTAQKSADAAFAQVEAAKSTQRAQLRIDFVDPEWSFNEESGGYRVRFRVILDGITRAYVLSDSIIAYIAQRPREKGAWMAMGLPRNFTPELSPYFGDTILKTNQVMPETETDPSKVLLAKEGKLAVFLNGSILYRDIFGDEWMLEIDRYWKPWSSFGDKDGIGGEWYPVGSGCHDTHRKVDTNYRDQLLK